MKKVANKTSKISNINKVRSIVFKHANDALKAMPIEARTDLQWSKTLKNSWNIIKNNIKDMDFNTIYNKYYQQIFIHINNKLFNNSDIAQELCNDTFIKFNTSYLSTDNYDYNKAKITTLLYHIANNVIIDYFRSKQAKITNNNINISDFSDNETGKEFFEIIDNSSYSDNEINDNELSNNMNNAINTLKPQYKEIIELSMYKELSYKEISEIMNIPISSVSVYLLRAKNQLKKSLQKDYQLL